jgi:hypothetical protein
MQRHKILISSYDFYYEQINITSELNITRKNGFQGYNTRDVL